MNSAPELHAYIVALRLPEELAEGRTEVGRQNQELGAEFRRRLQQVVEDQRLEEEIRFLSQPMNLPILLIEATERIANMVRAMPEVDSVQQDSQLIVHVS